MPPPNPCFGSLAPSLPQRLVLGLTRIPPLYRGSLRPTWVKVIDLLRKGPVDVRSTYGHFRVYPTSNLVDGAILLHPAYNKEEIDFLQEGLPASGTFVDIGANIGLYTVALGNRLTSQGRVVAIEPNPICLERLKANIALNDLAGVTVFGVGVGGLPRQGAPGHPSGTTWPSRTSSRDDQNGTFRSPHPDRHPERRRA